MCLVKRCVLANGFVIVVVVGYPFGRCGGIGTAGEVWPLATNDATRGSFAARSEMIPHSRVTLTELDLRMFWPTKQASEIWIPWSV